LYSWSKLTPLEQVRVVILNQEPYDKPGLAHGLAFSTPTIQPRTNTVRNIYHELKYNYPEFEVPPHGDLSTWALQGVLLLNICQTVWSNHLGIHMEKGWETFAERIIDAVDRYGANVPSKATGKPQGVVFLAWGAKARALVAKLDKAKHLVLPCSSPSPHSAHQSFYGLNHFQLCNEWLNCRYGAEWEIKWCSPSFPIQVSA
ncbi:uracil-DNA glycosylase-like protein, partial [Irpex lacteus]